MPITPAVCDRAPGAVIDRARRLGFAHKWDCSIDGRQSAGESRLWPGQGASRPERSATGCSRRGHVRRPVAGRSPLRHRPGTGHRRSTAASFTRADGLADPLTVPPAWPIPRQARGQSYGILTSADELCIKREDSGMYLGCVVWKKTPVRNLTIREVFLPGVRLLQSGGGRWPSESSVGSWQPCLWRGL